MSETRRLLLEFETEEVGIRAQKDKRVKKALVAAFSDSSDIVRERALMASIDVGDPTLVTDIVKSLDDDDDDVRIAGAQALAFYHQPRTVPYLMKGLKDENTWVRSHCAAGLSKLMNGPIWGRIGEDDLNVMNQGFPEKSDDEIRLFLQRLKVRPNGIDNFLKWKAASFDVEIDVTEFIKELEETPLVLVEEFVDDEADLESIRKRPTPKSGISQEVEEILSEIPEDVRETLPSEDLARLTPDTARELVDSIKASFPRKEEPSKEPSKKKVKVRKVTKVRRKRSGPSRQDLLDSIPDEVKQSVSDDVLKGLTYEELEALVASTTEGPAEERSPKKEAEDIKKKGKAERDELITQLPREIRSSISTEMMEKLTENDLKQLVTKGTLSDARQQEIRLEMFRAKYGSEKADVLVMVSDEMLEGIPEEQIHEMDVETLKALVQALEPS
ncbi:MAG: HEAT repeat domain-containing protein [Candidatus Thorarchaeota archaeon]|nr:HEAT repeat domain-containing protein [Candidatus Thorarchaeota archaeon]